MPKSKLIEVERFKNPKSLSEIYQQTGIIFAFMTSPKNGYKACHEWVKCRDFLQDAVRTQLTGNACSIYGFKFDSKVNPPVDTCKMRMLVSKYSFNENELLHFREKMTFALSLINHFEKLAKISLTHLQEVNVKDSVKKMVFLFTGSKIWVQSPFLISMYTLLIRLGDKELKFKNAIELKEKFKDLSNSDDNGKTTDNDARYLKILWDKLHKIIENRAKLFTKEEGVHDIYWKNVSTSNFHNNTGIWSLAKSITPDDSLNKRMTKLV